jgi:hypothetical protein
MWLNRAVMALVLAGLLPSAASARSINDGIGRTSFTWLKAFADADISSTGETFAARDGIEGLFVQPAAIAGIDRRAVKLSYVSYYVDSQFGTIGYAQPFRGDALGVRITYVNYGSFEGRTINNEPSGSFTAGDFGLTVNYGRQLRDDLKVGLAATFISSKIEDFSAQGAAVDVGALYYPPFAGLTVGAALMNVGTIVEQYSGGYRETMPVYFSVGARKSLAHAPITLFADVQFPNDSDITYSYGLEIAVRDALFLHAGTKSRSKIDRESMKSSTDFAGRPMFGFSLNVRDYRFGYAYCPDDDLENVHKVTLSAWFD